MPVGLWHAGPVSDSPTPVGLPAPKLRRRSARAAEGPCPRGNLPPLLPPVGGFLTGISSRPAATVSGDHPVVPETPEMCRNGPAGRQGEATTAGPAGRTTREDRRSAGSWPHAPCPCRPGRARNICRRHATRRRASPTVPQHSRSSRNARAAPNSDHDSRTVPHPSQPDRGDVDPPPAHSSWGMVPTRKNIRPAQRRIPEPRPLPPPFRIIRPGAASRPQRPTGKHGIPRDQPSGGPTPDPRTWDAPTRPARPDRSAPEPHRSALVSSCRRACLS